VKSLCVIRNNMAHRLPVAASCWQHKPYDAHCQGWPKAARMRSSRGIPYTSCCTLHPKIQQTPVTSGQANTQLGKRAAMFVNMLTVYTVQRGTLRTLGRSPLLASCTCPGAAHTTWLQLARTHAAACQSCLLAEIKGGYKQNLQLWQLPGPKHASCCCPPRMYDHRMRRWPSLPACSCLGQPVPALLNAQAVGAVRQDAGQSLFQVKLCTGTWC
jgi:hypothetical protein